MIQVTVAAEPEAFNRIVREPGLRSIAEKVGERPPRRKGRRFAKIAEERHLIPPDAFHPYWTEALDDLMTAYNFICAYSCFRIHRVTGAASVDHMVAKSRTWDRVYEWENYRLACSRLNSRKNNFTDVLDPFEVQDDWFQLELVAFQVIPNKAIHDKALRTQIETTIARLRLDDFCDDRAEDAEAYWAGDVSLSQLKKESPFVARELDRQGRLNPQDLDPS